MWCVLQISDKYHFEHVRSPSLIFLLHSIDGLAGLRPVSFRNPTAQRGGLIQPERQSTARRSLRASTTKWKCFTLWKVRNAEKIEPTKGRCEACREQIMKFHIPLELFRKPELPLTTDLPPSNGKWHLQFCLKRWGFYQFQKVALPVWLQTSFSGCGEIWTHRKRGEKLVRACSVIKGKGPFSPLVCPELGVPWRVS